MANSIRTPKQGLTNNSRAVAIAVDNEAWQEFRLSMKGRSTSEKLAMLEKYYKDGVISAMDGKPGYVYDHVCIRVDNYIKALCRGGQLHGGESLTSAIEAHWDLDIKK